MRKRTPTKLQKSNILIRSRLKLLRHFITLRRIETITNALYHTKHLDPDALYIALFDDVPNVMPMHIVSYIGRAPVHLDRYPVQYFEGSDLGLLVDPLGDCNQEIVPCHLKPWVYFRIGRTRLYLSVNRLPATLKDIDVSVAPYPINEYRILEEIMHSPCGDVRCIGIR